MHLRIPVLLKRIASLFALALVAAALPPVGPARAARPAAAEGACPYATAAGLGGGLPTADDPEAAVVLLINQERIRHGLWPLRANPMLRSAARGHSRDMAERGFFEHINPSGQAPGDRARAVGYPRYGWGDVFVGEAIAVGQTTAASTVASWLVSADHCAVLLTPGYREIGVGSVVAGDASQRRYWTLLVGSAPRVLPAFVNGGLERTQHRDVTLTLTDETVSSHGSLGRIAQVEVSEDPGFAGATWQPFPAGAPPDLPYQLSAGAGLKTIYVRYQDERGVTAEVSATISLTPPASQSGRHRTVLIPLVASP